LANVIPLVTPQYTLQTFINGEEIQINRNSFNMFIIYEMLEYNTHYAILYLNDISKNFKNDCFATGEILKFKIKFEDEDKTEYESEYRIMNTELIVNNIYAINLIPEILNSVYDVVNYIINDSINKAMNEFNGRNFQEI
jgi:hypothetical protein